MKTPTVRIHPISGSYYIACTFFLLMGLILSSSIYAQGSLDYKGGMKVNLSEDGAKYFRLIHWHQVWIRSIENNPGTIGADGQPKDHTLDIGMRRSRYLMYGQINQDFLILAHWGINNQTFTNGGGSGTGGLGGYGAGKKPQLFLHDAWTEYKVANNLADQGNSTAFSLHIGAGLHYWNGLSRASSASTLNFMPADLTILAYPGIEITDQFARQYGIYAKGQIGMLAFRVSANKPFIADNRANLSATRAVNIPTENWSIGGYFEYQLRERESDLLPYKVGTYVGTKDVFNIGAGFYHHPEASGTGTPPLISDSNVGLVQNRQNHTHFAVDVFMDRPLNKEKGTAFTWYSVAYFYDYGPNYFRSVGLLNVNPSGTPGSDRTIAGFGNAEPLMGTGLISYNTIGYLLPKDLSKSFRIQPFMVFTHKDLDYLGTAIQNYDIGINLFRSGHQAKITLQYSSRPIVTSNNGQFEASSRAGAFILQTQIVL